MNTKKLQAAIEAILFTMGESVELSKIAAAIEQDEPTTRGIISEMMTAYEKQNRGIRIIELDHSFQLCKNTMIISSALPDNLRGMYSRMLCWRRSRSLHTVSR